MCKQELALKHVVLIQFSTDTAFFQIGLLSMTFKPA